MASTKEQLSEFQEQAESGSVGFVAEFWDFLRYNKKWWLLPIVVTLVALGILVALGSTVAAPFIYTLF